MATTAHTNGYNLWARAGAKAADVIDTATGGKEYRDEQAATIETLRSENLRLRRKVAHLNRQLELATAENNLTVEQRRIRAALDDTLTLCEDYQRSGKLNQQRARLHFGINSRRYAFVCAVLRAVGVRQGDSWGKLCQFLGVPVPERPYPHTNHGKPVGPSVEDSSI